MPSDAPGPPPLPAPLRVADAHFLTARVLTGGSLDGWDEDLAHRQLAELVQRGVTHLVDARAEADDRALVAARAPRIAYLHAGVDDAGQQMPDAWFDRVTEFTLEALLDPSAMVLLHCHAGVNRGPSAAYAVLLALGHDPVAALELLLDRRPVAYVDYALDALDWHLRRDGADDDERRREHDRLSAYRRARLPAMAPRLHAPD